MIADQGRCFHCANYSVSSDICELERCCYKRVSLTGRTCHYRTRRADVLRDMTGAAVEGGGRKPLKPSKLRTTAAESPISLEDEYGDESWS